jgi:hypothetical protein
MSKKKRQKDRQCKTKGCRRSARPHRTICNTCDKKIWRQKYPMKASFQSLRQNTRRREKIQGKPKPFTITFEDFKEFCYETEYMAGKGRNKNSHSVDCIVEELGYVRGNLQKLTVSENSLKEHARRKKVLSYDWQTGTATVISEIKNEDTDNPF